MAYLKVGVIALVIVVVLLLVLRAMGLIPGTIKLPGGIEISGIKKVEQSDDTLSPKEREVYGEAIKQLTNRYYSDAIKKFDQITAAHPDHALSYQNRGIAYYKLGEYQQARDDFERASKLKPESLDIRFNLGAVYLSLNNNKKGLEIFKEIIKKDPNDVRSHYNLGLAFQRLGEFKDAQNHYLTVIGAKREKVEDSAFNLAAVYAAQIKEGNCKDSKLRDVLKNLELSLGTAQKEGRTSIRLGAINGERPEEGTEVLGRVRACPQLKKLLQEYQ